MKRRFLVILIAVAIVIALPIASCYADVTSPGTFFQDTGSGVPGASWQSANGYIKYNYDSDALLSRYYYTAGGNTWFAFPISAPVNAGGGETNNAGGYELGRSAAMGGGDLNSAIPAYGVTIAFRNTCDGPVTGYGVCNANYSTLFDAYATILKYGYGGIEDIGYLYGLGTSQPDQAARYYATNMAMQRISMQGMSHSDIGGFTSAHVNDLRVSNYEYALEDAAKRILCSNKTIFPNLQGYWGTPTRLNSTTVSIPLTANVPAGENPGYYSNNTGFYWTNLGNISCPNYASVASAMSTFNYGTSVTSNLQIDSSWIKGGETLSFALAGKVADQQYYTRIFATYGPHVQSFIIGDPSSANNTTNIRNLDTVVISTTLPLFDVQTTNITCNASYNTGDSGTISVTYKNNSTLPAVNVPVSLASSSSLGTPFTITNPNQTISELQAGASTTINYTVKANTLSGNATATFTAKIGYNTDNSTRFKETNYSNNTLTKTTTVYSLPDLTVSSLTTDKSTYEAGDTVTVTAVAANLGYTPVTSTTMKLEISGIGTQSKAVSSLAANGGTRTVTFTFTAPTALNSQTITLKATIDPDNTVAESNESNNTRTATLTVNALRPDITITNTTVQNWYAGKEAVVSATVKNLTAQPVPSVTVRFSVGSIMMTESIPVAGNGTNLAVFRFTVPPAGNYTASFAADPSGQLGETNESNNTWSGQVTVVNLPPSTVIDPDNPGMKQQYDVYGLKELPPTSNSDYYTWQEERLVSGNYVTQNFWARLTTTFAISPDSRIAEASKPDTMESGFGIQVQCTTTLTSNYDHPEDLIGPQMAWVLYPESGYGQTSDWQNVRDTLETQSGQVGDWTVTWQYAINPYSATDSRLHYTPLWFPDGAYTALAQVFYAWSPVGQLYDYPIDSVTISGDMYDRVTTVDR